MGGKQRGVRDWSMWTACANHGRTKSAQQSSSGLQITDCFGSAWSPTSSTTARQHDMTWHIAQTKRWWNFLKYSAVLAYSIRRCVVAGRCMVRDDDVRSMSGWLSDVLIEPGASSPSTSLLRASLSHTHTHTGRDCTQTDRLTTVCHSCSGQWWAKVDNKVTKQKFNYIFQLNY